MSHSPKAYNQLYINAWTVLSLLAAFVMWAMYVCGTQLLHFFGWVWDLIRYLASPII
jgi:hypothetical protein